MKFVAQRNTHVNLQTNVISWKLIMGRVNYQRTFINKSAKGHNFDKSSSRHSIKCSCTSSKLKLKLKKNGFFEESEILNSQRADGRHTEKITGDLTMVEQ